MACIKENKHAYLFSLCFGNSRSCVQIKSIDYCDGVSVKLKYLNLYDYIFNPVTFIISLEDSHFGSREKMPVSHQNSEILKKQVQVSQYFLASLFYTDIL